MIHIPMASQSWHGRGPYGSIKSHGKTHPKPPRKFLKRYPEIWHQPIEMGFSPYGIDLISIGISDSIGISIF